MIVEVIYSSIFCFVALNCMASLRNNPKDDGNQFFALAVGFVGIAGGHTTGTISGAFFNPAVTLGFGLTNGSVGQRAWTLLYAGYQFAGAFVGAALFFMVRPEELRALGITGQGLSCRRACSALSLCSNREEKASEPAQEPGRDEEAPGATHLAQRKARSPVAARLLSEFLGTFVVTITFTLSTFIVRSVPTTTTPMPQNATEVMTEAEKLARYHAGQHVDRNVATVKVLESSTVAWATGAAVLCMVYSLGGISGGHFNPAVTFASLCSASCGGVGRRRCRPFLALAYMVVQAGASIVAALVCLCVQRRGGPSGVRLVLDIGPKTGYGWPSVAVGECVFTLAVALSVLCTTTVRDPRYSKAPTTRSFHFAFAIGMCVTAGGFALEGISGGNLNPAVSLGVSTANFFISGLQVGTRASRFLYYLFWQMLGGALAAVVFRAAHPLEYKEDPLLS